MMETTEKERADMIWVKAQSIGQLVYAGFTPDSVRNAIVQNNLSLLRTTKVKKTSKENVNGN